MSMLTPAQFSEVIGALQRTLLAGPPSGPQCSVFVDSPSVQHAQIARDIMRIRAGIQRFLDERLFADPAFDMLLDLFASEAEGRRVQAGHLCHAARVPATTALRWIGKLEDAGLVERTADARDSRRTLIKLTAQAQAALTNYLHYVLTMPALRQS